MISCFSISPLKGDILFQRLYSDTFTDAQLQQITNKITWSDEEMADFPLIRSDDNSFFIFVLKRHSIIYSLVTEEEFPPLLITTLLERIDLMITTFFGEKDLEKKIKQQYIFLFLMCEEFFDKGMPNCTEPSFLLDLFETPSLLGLFPGKQISKDDLPLDRFDGMMWRSRDIQYMQNEFYMDIVESYHAICRENGHIATSYVSGELKATSKVSGMPDLAVSFNNPHVLEEVSLHPCVRLPRWKEQKVLSFVPPDGKFVLLSYRSGCRKLKIPAPVSVSTNFSLLPEKASFSVYLTSQFTHSQPLRNVQLDLKLPKISHSLTITVTMGTFTYSTISKKGRWSIETLPPSSTASLSGQFNFPPSFTYGSERNIKSIKSKSVRKSEGESKNDSENDSKRESKSINESDSNIYICKKIIDSNIRPSATLSFVLNDVALSGIEIKTISVESPEEWKLAKGFRMVSKGGEIDVRF
ncbi:Adaptor protein complex 3 (AP-3), mu subunitB [Monocercomonoides exilis]|uniref:Adaptor protein complex 3 (AP-3), mu subunitB n=1 Tax=Monocercomonoides exilis TaxID=2049356 RepID=UPI0035596F5C|nr:Adaptor protein complex 3 (AP-3), mu subunitB [Monocercomonoides exilis]|eukprot:MONOS_6612.1-p1 / transcript=MONOS_6612.1 / gene=MONOS_6612 / organism=Monocercomonoides_exilis_PA203 / gene_product= Adaptor protein complex 3 (AP-3), mu subunit B / transcript_product= Adaptor protein complex 3 (AP-3), mu subunit B / location=Mono_scaffold00211:35409-38341(-) / protein_length=469 / sequence_SO=supercontig / SO=protein_coding / is_pseudo=false